MLYSSQLYGAGKTFFATNLLSVLHEDLKNNGTITQNLLTSPPIEPTKDRCRLSALRLSQEGHWDRNLIQKFVGARFLLVNCAQLPSGNTLEEGIFKKLHFLATGKIIENISYNYDNVIEKWNESLLEQGKPPHNGKWFLFFDEIGCMESKAFLRKYGMENEPNPHTIFFRILEPFLLNQVYFLLDFFLIVFLKFFL